VSGIGNLGEPEHTPFRNFPLICDLTTVEKPDYSEAKIVVAMVGLLKGRNIATW
jgi:hypothetical protein